MTVEFLDTNQILVDENGKSTPYLEDYLFQLVNSLGGEGAPNVNTIIEETIEGSQLSRLRSSISALKNRVSDLENTETTPVNLLSLKKSIADIESQLNQPINLKGILDKINDIEVQITPPVNLKGIMDRLDTIEAQL